MAGPPGTGKTLLARAVAGEAHVPFLSITGSSFVEMFVGVGAARVRDLFQQARDRAPAIVFIDEIDALGARRDARSLVGNDEREQTLNQLLAEMDGFEPSDGVVILAATNRPDALDPALRRPGRFDREIVVPLPNRGDRQAILATHARGKDLEPDVDLGQVAAATPGFSGADLANLVNEAALTAVRVGRTGLISADFADARDRVMLGARDRSVRLTLDELATVAVHEAGHALVATLSPHADPVSRVTVLVREFGLSQAIGPVSYGGTPAQPFPGLRPLRGYSEHTQWLIDREVAVLLTSAQARARELLTRHMEALHKLTTALLDQETISGDQVAALVQAA
jgi:cell division protease FtsH